MNKEIDEFELNELLEKILEEERDNEFWKLISPKTINYLEDTDQKEKI